jgi:hypothetical protein
VKEKDKEQQHQATTKPTTQAAKEKNKEQQHQARTKPITQAVTEKDKEQQHQATIKPTTHITRSATQNFATTLRRCRASCLRVPAQATGAAPISSFTAYACCRAAAQSRNLLNG